MQVIFEWLEKPEAILNGGRVIWNRWVQVKAGEESSNLSFWFSNVTVYIKLDYCSLVWKQSEWSVTIFL